MVRMKTNMKRVISILLCMIFVMAQCVTMAAATANQYEFGYGKTEEVDGARMSAWVDQDGKVHALVAVDNYDLTEFDFGIAYNEEVLTVEKIKWSVDFVIAYNGHSGMSTYNDNNGEKYAHPYVVFGGTAKDSVVYSGNLIEITFAAKTTELTGTLNLVKDSAEYYKDISQAPALISFDMSKLPKEDENGKMELEKEYPYGYGTTVETEVAVMSGWIDKDQVVHVLVGVKDQNLVEFDYGVAYDENMLTFKKSTWEKDFLIEYSQHSGINTFHDNNDPGKYAHPYVVMGGTAKEDVVYYGKLMELTFDMKGAELGGKISLVKDSANYYEDISQAPALATLDVSELFREKEEGTIEVGKEEKENVDGSVTEIVTEQSKTELGELIERVIESTKKSDGVLIIIVKENINKEDGSKETSKSETTQQKSGESWTTKTTQKTESDGTTNTTVSNEKKDSDGKSLEQYEYDKGTLPDGVQWDNDKEDKTDKDTHDELKSEGAKDGYDIFDITPKVDGDKVDAEGKVTVRLYVGQKNWDGIKVHVYDFKNRIWIEARYEDGYVIFTTSHFSRYAVAEVKDVMTGDVDNNDKVELSDAQLILRKALKLTDLTQRKMEAADTDSNGKVELKDAQVTLRVALKLSTF